MTTYTDEVNIYNPDAIEDAVESAGQTASSFITEVSADNGIVVATAGHGTTNGAITSNTTGWHLGDVLEYIRQGVSRFWIGLKESGDTTPTVRIGKAFVSGASDNESHMELDYHSLQLIDKEGNTYFHVSDLRDSSGYYHYTKVFTGDGQTDSFNISVTSLNAGVTYIIDSVTIDGVPTDNYTQNPLYKITLTSAPSLGAEIIVTAACNSQMIKAYTLGVRKENSSVGDFSFVAGSNCAASGSRAAAFGMSTASNSLAFSEGDATASGYISHAESVSVASGSWSHSQNYTTTASGSSSHAEGNNTEARGDNSHAQNESTTAAKRAQTTLGTYNVLDSASTTTHPSNNINYGTYAVIVGNGTADNARSDAALLTWTGDAQIAGHVKDLNGTKLYADASHAHAASDITSGTLSIARGGTGGSSASNTTTVSSVITAGSGVSISSVSARRWGPICILEIIAEPTADKSGTWTVGTLKSGFVPLNQCTASEWGGGLQARIATTGVISAYGSRSKNSNFSIGAAYFWKSS